MATSSASSHAMNAAPRQTRFAFSASAIGPATLQKALNALFHPDKLWQIGFHRLCVKLDSQQSPRSVFAGNLDVRPVALRSDGSEDHLASINVRQFGASQ